MSFGGLWKLGFNFEASQFLTVSEEIVDNFVDPNSNNEEISDDVIDCNVDNDILFHSLENSNSKQDELVTSNSLNLNQWCLPNFHLQILNNFHVILILNLL